MVSKEDYKKFITQEKIRLDILGHLDDLKTENLVRILKFVEKTRIWPKIKEQLELEDIAINKKKLKDLKKYNLEDEEVKFIYIYEYIKDNRNEISRLNKELENLAKKENQEYNGLLTSLTEFFNFDISGDLNDLSLMKYKKEFLQDMEKIFKNIQKKLKDEGEINPKIIQKQLQKIKNKIYASKLGISNLTLNTSLLEAYVKEEDSKRIFKNKFLNSKLFSTSVEQVGKKYEEKKLEYKTELEEIKENVFKYAQILRDVFFSEDNLVLKTLNKQRAKDISDLIVKNIISQINLDEKKKDEIKKSLEYYLEDNINNWLQKIDSHLTAYLKKNKDRITSSQKMIDYVYKFFEEEIKPKIAKENDYIKSLLEKSGVKPTKLENLPLFSFYSLFAFESAVFSLFKNTEISNITSVKKEKAFEVILTRLLEKENTDLITIESIKNRISPILGDKISDFEIKENVNHKSLTEVLYGKSPIDLLEEDFNFALTQKGNINFDKIIDSFEKDFLGENVYSPESIDIWIDKILRNYGFYDKGIISPVTKTKLNILKEKYRKSFYDIVQNFRFGENPDEFKEKISQEMKNFIENIKEELKNEKFLDNLFKFQDIKKDLLKEAKEKGQFDVLDYIRASIYSELTKNSVRIINAIKTQFSADTILLNFKENEIKKEKIKDMVKNYTVQFLKSEDTRKEIERVLKKELWRMKDIIKSSALIAEFYNGSKIQGILTEEKILREVINQIVSEILDNEYSSIVKEMENTLNENIFNVLGINDDSLKEKEKIVNDFLKGQGDINGDDEINKRLIQIKKGIEGTLKGYVKEKLLVGKNITKQEKSIVDKIVDNFINKILNYKENIDVVEEGREGFLHINISPENRSEINRILASSVEEVLKKDKEKKEKYLNNLYKYHYKRGVQKLMTNLTNLNNILEDLKIASKIKRRSWQFESNQVLITQILDKTKNIIESLDEDVVLSVLDNEEFYAIFSVPLNKENLIKAFEKLETYLSPENSKSIEEIQKILLGLFNQDKINTQLKTFEKILKREDKADMILKILQEKQQEIKSLIPHLELEKQGYETRYKTTERLKKIIRHTKFTLGEIIHHSNMKQAISSSIPIGKINYEETLNVEKNKEKQETLSKSFNIEYKTKAGFSEEIFYTLLNQVPNIDNFVGFLKKVYLGKDLKEPISNIEFKKIIDEFIKKNMIIEYNPNNGFFQKYKDTYIRPLFKSEKNYSTFEKILTYLVSQEMNKNIKILQAKNNIKQEDYEKVVEDSIVNIKKVFEKEKIIIEDKEYSLSPFREYIEKIQLLPLKRNFEYVLKNAINLNPKFGTLYFRGLDSSKIKQNIAKAIKEHKITSDNDKIEYLNFVFYNEILKNKQNILQEFGLKKIETLSELNKKINDFIEKELNKFETLANNIFPNFYQQWRKIFENSDLYKKIKIELAEKLSVNGAIKEEFINNVIREKIIESGNGKFSVGGKLPNNIGIKGIFDIINSLKEQYKTSENFKDYVLKLEKKLENKNDETYKVLKKIVKVIKNDQSPQILLNKKAGEFTPKRLKNEIRWLKNALNLGFFTGKHNKTINELFKQIKNEILQIDIDEKLPELNAQNLKSIEKIEEITDFLNKNIFASSVVFEDKIVQLEEIKRQELQKIISSELLSENGEIANTELGNELRNQLLYKTDIYKVIQEYSIKNPKSVKIKILNIVDFSNLLNAASLNLNEIKIPLKIELNITTKSGQKIKKTVTAKLDKVFVLSQLIKTIKSKPESDLKNKILQVSLLEDLSILKILTQKREEFQKSLLQKNKVVEYQFLKNFFEKPNSDILDKYLSEFNIFLNKNEFNVMELELSNLKNLKAVMSEEEFNAEIEKIAKEKREQNLNEIKHIFNEQKMFKNFEDWKEFLIRKNKVKIKKVYFENNLLIDFVKTDKEIFLKAKKDLILHTLDGREIKIKTGQKITFKNLKDLTKIKAITDTEFKTSISPKFEIENEELYKNKFINTKLDNFFRIIDLNYVSYINAERYLKQYAQGGKEKYKLFNERIDFENLFQIGKSVVKKHYDENTNDFDIFYELFGKSYILNFEKQMQDYYLKLENSKNKTEIYQKIKEKTIDEILNILQQINPSLKISKENLYKNKNSSKKIKKIIEESLDGEFSDWFLPFSSIDFLWEKLKKIESGEDILVHYEYSKLADKLTKIETRKKLIENMLKNDVFKNSPNLKKNWEKIKSSYERLAEIIFFEKSLNEDNVKIFNKKIQSIENSIIKFCQKLREQMKNALGAIEAVNQTALNTYDNFFINSLIKGFIGENQKDYLTVSLIFEKTDRDLKKPIYNVLDTIKIFQGGISNIYEKPIQLNDSKLKQKINPDKLFEILTRNSQIKEKQKRELKKAIESYLQGNIDFNVLSKTIRNNLGFLVSQESLIKQMFKTISLTEEEKEVLKELTKFLSKFKHSDINENPEIKMQIFEKIKTALSKLGIEVNIQLENPGFYVSPDGGMVFLNPNNAISENEIIPLQEVNQLENTLINNARIRTFLDEFVSENNKKYSLVKKIINEEDPETKWLMPPTKSNIEDKQDYTNIYYLLENDRRTELKIQKLKETLDLIKNETIELISIDEYGNEKTEEVDVVTFFGLDNRGKFKTKQEAFKDFQKKVLEKFGEMSFHEKIEEKVKKELAEEKFDPDTHLYHSEFLSRYTKYVKEEIKKLKNEEKEYTINETFQEEADKLKENLKKVEKLEQLTKLYDLYETYNSLTDKYEKMLEVKGQLNEIFKNPQTIAIIKYIVLPRLEKQNPDLARNLKLRLAEKENAIKEVLDLPDNYSPLKKYDMAKQTINRYIQILKQKYEETGEQKYADEIMRLRQQIQSVENALQNKNILNPKELEELNREIEALFIAAKYAETKENIHFIIEETLVGGTKSYLTGLGRKLTEIGNNMLNAIGLGEFFGSFVGELSKKTQKSKESLSKYRVPALDADESSSAEIFQGESGLR